MRLGPDSPVRGVRWWAWLALGAFWLITIQIRPMLDPDEGRYAEIPREMVASGDWITPRLDGLKYFEKPALQYWATAAVYEAVGLSNWSSRLWTVLLGFACLPMVYAWAVPLYGRRAALAGAVLLALSPYFGLIGHLDLLDAGFTFWMCAAVFAFSRAQAAPAASGKEGSWMLLAWGTAALAVLSKGIVVLVLAGGTLIAYTALERDGKPWRRMHVLTGVPLFLALAAPWFVLVSVRNPEFAHYFFIRQHFERFLTPISHRVEPWWYFLPLLAVGSLPWLAPLGRGTLEALGEKGPSREFKPLKFLLLFCALTLVFFSMSDSKLATYILPIFPPIAALAGVAVAERPAALKRIARVAAGLALFVAGGLLVYSQHRNGTIPAQAVAWAIATAVAALVAVGATWRAAGWDSLRPPLLAAAMFIFAWQALLCEYTVIPPSRSAYQLVEQIRADVHPATALFSVGQYRQTIPPYLGRTLILVGYSGELGFGERQEPGREQASPSQFVKEWDASGDAIGFFSPQAWEHYRRQGLPGRVIAHDGFTVAVSRS